MSDEEDESCSEGFSASEDEWKPGKHAHGESSDDDDSDFEEVPGSAAKTSGSSRKREPKTQAKARQGDGAGAAKKRKPMGQSLRAKLYNKYRPPPKTFPSNSSSVGNNSPTASSSRAASKNGKTPNEVEEDDSSSDSSVGNHLANPADLDLASSFFSIENKVGTNSAFGKRTSIFDCSAGILSDSNSEEDNKEEDITGNDDDKTSKAFDFRNLLEKANSLERAKEQIAKRSMETNAKKATKTKSSKSKETAIDVSTLLALGEKKTPKMTNHDIGAEEDDEEDDDEDDVPINKRAPSKLNKTKSTRVKRHTKTRPTSSIVTSTSTRGGEAVSDDSDWEEVADYLDDSNECRSTGNLNNEENLEILVEMPSRKRNKEAKTQHDLDLALRRRLNRELKDKQMLLHKASLLCQIGRSYQYNRLLNDTDLMQSALKLLPGTKAYPRETGTDLKYFQSFVTWFKTVIKLTSANLYPERDKIGKNKKAIKAQLKEQIIAKQARCRQDFIFIFISLIRGMGLQCRLVVNMQPLPLKPSQEDLLSIKLKPDNGGQKKTKEVKVSVDKSNIEHSKLKEESKSIEKLKGKERNKEEETESPKMEKKGKIEKLSLSQKLDRNDNKTTAIEDINKNKEIKEISDDKKFERSKQIIQTRNRSKFEKIKRSTDEKATDLETQIKKPKTSEENKQIENERSTNPLPVEKKEGRGTKSKKQEEVPKVVVENFKSTYNEKRMTRSKSKKSDTVAICPSLQPVKRSKSRSVSPLLKISPQFLQTNTYREKFSPEPLASDTKTTKIEIKSRSRSKSPRPLISTEFLNSKKKREQISPKPITASDQKENKEQQMETNPTALKKDSEKNRKKQPVQSLPTKRVLRCRKNLPTNTNDEEPPKKKATRAKLAIPQLDGADDDVSDVEMNFAITLPQFDGAHDVDEMSIEKKKQNRPHLNKLKKTASKSEDDSDEDFEPSPLKHIKRAPVLPKAVQNLRKDRRVLSSDNETDGEGASPSKDLKKATAGDMWVEVWSDVENEWICVDLVIGKLHSVESIRKSASSNLAYVFAFQNDLSLKDVTARYCPNWSTTVRKNRVEKPWLDKALAQYQGIKTDRDIREDHDLRRIHEDKPMPTAISDFKDHPLYVLERHLLQYQALYPPDAPPLGYTKTKEPIYSRDCVHTLHSREIWLKQARTVKLGEQPYKIVKRSKWDRLTRTILKQQPLEVFGYWQTQDYEPPTAENGLVPRNAYGNVELFKECMLPKKTKHIRLPGLNRICKKLGIDCANAVVGFDFHQGACHPTYDGFVVCEEFADDVTAAWYQDQEEQERKEQEKYEARVYGNWKKLIRGLLIRERLKRKYNF